MKKEQNLQLMIEKVRKQDRRTLAQAITLVESQNPEHQEQIFSLLDGCLPYFGAANRIGISGPPGVGKSTFIEALGLYLIEQGKKIAVLTIDPSSTINRGSILGDKTRMPKLSVDRRAFIRPSPSLGILGGVTASTREVILLCEAGGFDVVLIETVGVGQSESVVASMVDTMVLLIQPGSGDELQGVKKGILELVDIIVMNKADGDLKKLASGSVKEYARSMSLRRLSKNKNWKVPVLKASALYQEGMEKIWKSIEEHRNFLNTTGSLEEKRRVQAQQWFFDLIVDNFLRKLKTDKNIKDALEQFFLSLSSQKISVTHAAFLAFKQLVQMKL